VVKVQSPQVNAFDLYIAVTGPLSWADNWLSGRALAERKEPQELQELQASILSKLSEAIGQTTLVQQLCNTPATMESFTAAREMTDQLLFLRELISQETETH